jgi:hypothetical protein
MSQYRIWIKAEELMKRWEVEPLDLADFVLEGKLTAYHTDKTPIDLDFERKSFVEKVDYYGEIYGEGSAWFGLADLSYLHDKIDNYLFKYEEVLTIEKQFDLGKDIKLRPVQKHKKECREIAKSIWKQMPELNIAEMIRRDEITIIRLKKKPKQYSERTIRGWIKNLCPNPKSGRRPKPK